MRRTIIITALLLTILAPGAVATAPAAPSGLSVTGSTSNSVSLSWTQSANYGDADFDGHFIYQTGEHTNTYWLAKETGCCAIVASIGMDPGEEYCFTVTAINDASEESSPTSQVCETTPTPATPPGAIGNLAATTISASRIDLSWTAPVSGDPQTGYSITKDNVAAGTLGPGATGYGSIDLTASTEYCYTVTPFNSAGNGPTSGPVCETTDATAAVVPSVPQNFAVSPWDSEWTATFTAPASDGGAAIQGYNLYVAESLVSEGENPGELSFTRPAANGATFTVEVRAHNEAGEGPGASQSVTVGAPATAPSAPVLESVEALSASSLFVDWTLTKQGGLPASYPVFRDGVQVATMTPTAMTDVDLLANTEYCYTVKATNEHGSSVASNEVCASTNTTLASVPGAVQGLVYDVAANTGGDGAQVTVSWEAPLTDGGADVQRYNVYVNGVSRTFVSGNAVALDVTLQGPENDPHGGLAEGSYTIIVKAQNEAGEGTGATVTFQVVYADIPGVSTNSGGGVVVEPVGYLDYWPAALLGVFGIAAVGAGASVKGKGKKARNRSLGLYIIAATMAGLAIYAGFYPEQVLEAIGL